MITDSAGFSNPRFFLICPIMNPLLLWGGTFTQITVLMHFLVLDEVPLICLSLVELGNATRWLSSLLAASSSFSERSHVVGLGWSFGSVVWRFLRVQQRAQTVHQWGLFKCMPHVPSNWAQKILIQDFPSSPSAPQNARVAYHLCQMPSLKHI